MVKKGYGALIIGANSSCSNLNFFKKGEQIHSYHSYYYSSCFFSPVGLLLSAVERRSRLRIFSGQTRCR